MNFKVLTIFLVSTHSRPKAAAAFGNSLSNTSVVSTHSRPKAAAYPRKRRIRFRAVSTHSRPKAAANIVEVVDDE